MPVDKKAKEGAENVVEQVSAELKRKDNEDSEQEDSRQRKRLRTDEIIAGLHMSSLAILT